MSNFLRQILLFSFCFSLIPVFGQTFNAFKKAGTKAYEAERFDEAVFYYKEALKLRKKDETVLLNTATAYYKLRDFTKANNYNQRILENNKTDIESLFLQGMILKESGKCEEAKKYFNQTTKDSLFTQKALFEIKGCDLLTEFLQDSTAKIIHLDKTINSNYSDFGTAIWQDSVLYFSSMRYAASSKLKQPSGTKVSKIMSSTNGQKAKSFRDKMNDKTMQNANPTIDESNNIIYYTKCDIGENPPQNCQIYSSKFTKGKWQTGELLNEVNQINTNSTQPHFTVIDNEKVLFFVSDRNGSKDISYYNFNTKSLQELPKSVNTNKTEQTPFFDKSTQELYFSSDGFPNIGGFDVFKINWKNVAKNEPIWLPKPYNSSLDDVYFFKQNDSTAYLTSNREGSYFLNRKSCCYDIWKLEMEEKIEQEKPIIIEPKDTQIIVQIEPEIPMIKIDSPKVEIIPKPKNTLEELLPIALYFHNDQPNAKTTDTVSTLDYEQTYVVYKQMQQQYEYGFSLGKFDLENTISKQAVKTFFEQKLVEEHNKLEQFCVQLEKIIDSELRIEIKVKGFTSPLAKDDYNIALANRRINSFEKHLNNYKGGILSKYLNNGQLKIIKTAFGETTVPEGVSDDYYDTQNSIYNPKAASERRIEIIAIEICECGAVK